MKSQLQNQETRLPAQPGAETSRIAAAISRILLIHRVTAQTAAPAASSTTESAPSRQLDATPVEWALRMMF